MNAFLNSVYHSFGEKMFFAHGYIVHTKNVFGNILSFTGVESGFFADSANTCQYLPFELLKLDQCANSVSCQK